MEAQLTAPPTALVPQYSDFSRRLLRCCLRVPQLPLPPLTHCHSIAWKSGSAADTGKEWGWRRKSECVTTAERRNGKSQSLADIRHQNTRDQVMDPAGPRPSLNVTIARPKLHVVSPPVVAAGAVEEERHALQQAAIITNDVERDGGLHSFSWVHRRLSTCGIDAGIYEKCISAAMNVFGPSRTPIRTHLLCAG